MKRHIAIVFAVCALFFAGIGKAYSQVQVTVTPAIDTIGVNDTISVSVLVHNFDTATLIVSLQATYRGNILDTINFRTPGNAFIPGNDSVLFNCSIINTVSDPLPGLAPGGGSVVVWPIFTNAGPIDTGHMTLYYLGPAGINDIQLPPFSVFYSNNQLNISFTQLQPADITIYDMQGRVMRHLHTNNRQTNVDVATLANGVYVVTLQAAQKTRSIKFVKY